MLKSLLSLVYPTDCAVCGTSLLSAEKLLCLNCHRDLPLTRFWLWEQNAMARSLYGRFAFEQAAALFYFRPESPYRHLLHRFKYEGQREVGVYLSRMLGRCLLEAGETWKGIDYVIPVPLHRKKERKRGYNQSAIIAKTLAKELGIQSSEKLLKRITNAKSQTVKNRVERWINVQDDYAFNPHCALVPAHGSRLLLVDDVCTTGATLEACAQILLNTKRDYKIYVCTLAYVE